MVIKKFYSLHLHLTCSMLLGGGAGEAWLGEGISSTLLSPGEGTEL